MFYFIQNVAIIGQNLWLSDWTEDAVEYFNTTYPGHIRDMRIGVFGALGLAQGMSRKRFKKCFLKKNEPDIFVCDIIIYVKSSLVIKNHQDKFLKYS